MAKSHHLMLIDQPRCLWKFLSLYWVGHHKTWPFYEYQNLMVFGQAR